MRKIISSQTSKFTIRPGVVVRAEVGAPNPGTQVQDLPTRNFTVDTKAPAWPGDIASGREGDYLLIDYTHYQKTRTMQALRITHTLPWTRFQSEKDVLTGLDTGRGQDVVINPRLRVAIVPQPSLQELNKTRLVVRVYSGSPVLTGDKLGSYTVQSVRPRNGVQEIEAV